MPAGATLRPATRGKSVILTARAGHTRLVKERSFSGEDGTAGEETVYRLIPQHNPARLPSALQSPALPGG